MYTLVEPTRLAETLWQLTGYNNGKGGFVSVLADAEVTAVFGEDGTLSGSAGCNNYTAGYQVERSDISIGPIAATQKMCAEPEGIMEQEIQYLTALESATTYQIRGEQLELLNAEGTRLASYIAVPPASIKGTKQERPSPAGVSAPAKLTPTVTSGCSIFSAKIRQASRMRAELYARNVSSTSSATLSVPLMAEGIIRRMLRRARRAGVKS